MIHDTGSEPGQAGKSSLWALSVKIEQFFGCFAPASHVLLGPTSHPSDAISKLSHGKGGKQDRRSPSIDRGGPRGAPRWQWEFEDPP